MSHIFVSYCHEDKNYVERLTKTLQSKGFDVWYDKRIQIGGRMHSEIENKIDSCSALLVVYSNNTRNSDWVYGEFTYGDIISKPIMVLRLSGTPFIPLLSRKYEDVAGGKLPSDSFYEQLRELCLLEDNKKLKSEVLNNIKNRKDQMLYSEEDKVETLQERILQRISNFSDVTENNVIQNIGYRRGNYISLGENEIAFEKLLNGQVRNKYLVNIIGSGGMGKSYLLYKYYNIAKKTGYRVALIDLHSPRNRHREVILSEIINQLEISDINIQKSLDLILHPKGKDLSVNAKEKFEQVSDALIFNLKLVLGEAKYQQQKPVILFDTFDENPVVEQLSTWLFPKLVVELWEKVYFVIAGRKPLQSVSTISSEQLDSTLVINLSGLDDAGARKLLENHVKGLDLNDIQIDKAIFLARGSPLILQLLLFYISSFGKNEDLSEINDTAHLLEVICDSIWNGFLTKDNQVSPHFYKLFIAAVHFGSHFNLSIYKSITIDDEFRDETPEKIFDQLRNYFYFRGDVTRSGNQNWTLHDEIRNSMLARFEKRFSFMSQGLVKLSEIALSNYYHPRIQELQGAHDLTSDEEIELGDLEAQHLFHILFVNAASGDEAKDYHYKLWDRLDYLWHSFKLDQMAQVIQFGREVQLRKVGAKEDNFLVNILDISQSWMNYSERNFDGADTLTDRILNKPSIPKWLLAQALTVKGLMPNKDPKLVVQKYLEPAANIYEKMFSQQASGKIPHDGFIKSINLIVSLHQIFMGIGRVYINLFDLEKSEYAFRRAFNISASLDLRLPLYKAASLNELARVLRLRGDFKNALNSVIQAIAFYKMETRSPESDLNFGYFFETLGLIYKDLGKYQAALKAFDSALEVYSVVPGTLAERRATVTLEKGVLFFLDDNIDKAKDYLQEAHYVFNANKEKNPWYYLYSLDSLGEYCLRKNELEPAKKLFVEEKELAIQYGYDLWRFASTLHLEELNFKKFGQVNENILNEIAVEITRSQKSDYSSLLWKIKYLLSSFSLNEKNISVALSHLTDGLAYLAIHRKNMFFEHFIVFRETLIRLEGYQIKSEAERLIQIWKSKFPDVDPEPAFIDMCEVLIE